MPARPSSSTRSAPAAKPDRLQVQSVARAFRLLQAFSGQPRPMSLSQLAAAAGMDKSAAQRLSHTLLQLGYLEQGERGLRPGRRLLERSADYLRWNPLVGQTVPVLVDLGREAQEAVDLSLFDDLTMLYVLRLQSRRTAYHAQLVGRRVPTFCTSTGHAVLARLPEARARDIVARSDRDRLTPKTVTDPAKILAAVAEARHLRYALAAEQFRLGEIAIAAAVTDADGAPVGAVRIAGSLSDWGVEDFARRFAPLVIEAADTISGA